MNANKFIIIPDIVYQSSLNTTEMIVYGFIYSMSQKNGYCYAKNVFFEKELNMSEQQIQRAIRKLIKEEFIGKEIKNSKRHLTPKLAINTSNMTVVKSNLTPKKIINDTKRGVINDTHNRITNNKKNNKSIKKSIHAFSSSNQDKIEKLLIRCIEHLNKRYLNVSDYKIKSSEYKHIGIVFELFKSYLNHHIDSIDPNVDSFYKYLYCFYLDIKASVYKNKDHEKRKRYYPYRFKDKINKLKNFSFDNSEFKNEDYLKFKEELDDNDDYDPNANSVLNWLK